MANVKFAADTCAATVAILLFFVVGLEATTEDSIISTTTSKPAAIRRNCSSSVVRIETQGLLNYLATVRFPAPEKHVGEWRVDMETDVPFTFLGAFDAWVNSSAADGLATFRSREPTDTVEADESVVFRFRISWFTNEPKPEVLKMTWNQHSIICEPTTGSVSSIKAAKRARSLRSSRTSRRRLRLPVNRR